MRVLVYGLGRSGSAAARLLREQGHDVLLSDANPHEETVRELVALGCHWTDTPLEADAELCIAAPGVPFDHADLQALRARGLETIGEVEWVYRSVDAPLIGVTGTAGKGTVTRWIGETLQGAGIDARVGGNIDPALSAVAVAGKVSVAELSSFGLERAPTLKPDIAVALNLDVDHLDRHGSVEAYHEAKRNLVRHLDAGDTFIYNHDDVNLQRWAEATPARTLSFSTRGSADARTEEHEGEEWLVLDGVPLLPLRRLKVRGRHHHANALAVALACHAWGLSADEIRRGLGSFTGIPGRYSVVEVIRGVTFIEDSIATRGLAVQAALEATPAPIVWIAGGQDKGADLTSLKDLVRERVVLFIGIGEAGPVFADALKGLTKTVLCDETGGEAALRCACEQALHYLETKVEAHSKPVGGSVLLAPLAASFDQFRDYKTRGAAFRRVVAALKALLEPATPSLEKTEALWTRS